MSNSFELFSGKVASVQRQCEVLSDIVIDLKGKYTVLKGIEIQELVYWIC